MKSVREKTMCEDYIMRRVLLLGLLLVLAVTFAGCGKKEEEKASELSFEYSSWYEPSRKNFFSTEKNIIQKDLVANGVTSAVWKISDEDLNEIAALIKKYDVATLSEDVKKYTKRIGDFMETVSPLEQISFTYTLDGKTYTITTNNAILKGLPGELKVHNLSVFFDELTKILYRQKEYQSLPAAKGGYQ